MTKRRTPAKRRSTRAAAGAPGTPRAVRLEFDHDESDGDARAIAGELSALALAGDSLFVASDESSSIERLTRVTTGHDGRKRGGNGLTLAAHRSFPLADFVDLPGGAEAEVDVEGLAEHGGYLWLVGSHSMKRGNAKPDGKNAARQIEKLARVTRDPNRYLLARIPLVPDADGGTALAREAADGARPRTAARVMGGDAGSVLLDALRDDPHVGPYVQLPGKDNGLDVEGLTVVGSRFYIGLRGPVLRGWAIVLEIEPEDAAPGLLGLRASNGSGRTIRKHFLDLRGMGVRDLTTAPDGDVLVLAGPTMELAGDAAVFRWRPAKGHDDVLVSREELPKVLDLPYGRGEDEGVDHPEGLAVLQPDGGATSLLVAYDAPRADRVKEERVVLADLFELPG